MKFSTRNLYFVVYCVLFLFAVESAQAWSLSEFFQKEKEFVTHSRAMTSGVKELYRERGALIRFNNAALELVNTYKQLSAKGSMDLSKLVSVGQSIMTVVNDYQTLSPKFEKTFNRISPDIAYFSKMTDNPNKPKETPPAFTIPAFSDTQIAGFSRTGGIDRVWQTVKSDWTNVFRWGRLADEYKMGKAEDAYAYKTVQIGLEMYSLYDSTQACIKQLLSIKGDIEKIMGGNFGAILGASGTIDKVMNAGPYIDRLGQIANVTPKHLEKRLTELNKYQEEYLKTYQSYQKKYGTNAITIAAPTTQPTASQVIIPQVANQTSPTIVNSEIPQTSLPAMADQYKKLYQEYIKLSQKIGVSPEKVRDLGTQLKELNRKMKEASK